jgi:hypothetical protein
MRMIVRAFTCRPLRPAFDVALRDVLLPDLRACPGVLDVCAGRKGPDELGTRVVVSMWASLDAMHASMGGDIEASRFHPELLVETTDRHLEVMPVVLAVGGGPDASPPVGVLRIARGVLQGLTVEQYAGHVRAGVEEDRALGHGPRSLVLARMSQHGFATISRWTDWTSIQAATGASIHDPIRTQPNAEMTSFEADHYELVPTTVDEPDRTRMGRGGALGV